ncbi:Periplasmic thiol:disulfide interchange protein DsbA [hydrothermal vent metagenome]|uniref:Periplasmic thiol:disulfide interchange protein DsbA n=1 Tax=hydrothermal vent metagenome TaxID=652676 RepID=A0A3B1D6B3_9ZZZZ
MPGRYKLKIFVPTRKLTVNYLDSTPSMNVRKMVFLLLVVTLFSAVPAYLFADPAPAVQLYTNNPVVATVDGEYLMMNDLKTARMHDAMFQLYGVQSQALKEKILQQLAKKRPEFLKDEVPEVTEKDISRFYEKTPGVKDLGSPEKMRDEIREYLQRVFRDSYIEKKFQFALKKKWVKIHLKPPNDFKVVAELNSAMLWAKEDAKVSRKVFLLEYSDFQCPFCKRVQGTLKKLRKTYSEKVQFGYRHFPLPFHKEATFLAEAVECARDQDRFWEMQSVLYGIDDETFVLTEIELVKLAKKAGVKNLKEFQTCAQKRKYKTRVTEDMREGARLGIQGTPTFILGIYDLENGTVSGEMFSGAVSNEKFVEVIEKYLSLSRAEAKLVR